MEKGDAKIEALDYGAKSNPSGKEVECKCAAKAGASPDEVRYTTAKQHDLDNTGLS